MKLILPSDKKNILPYAGIFLVFALVYMPVYTGYYAFWDDYYLLAGEFFVQKLVQVLNEVMFRPLLAYSVPSLVSVLNFEQGNIVRFIHVFDLSVLACLIYSLLCRYGLGRFNSFLLSIIIFMLPTSQVLVSQIAGGMLIPAMILAAVAAVMALKGTARESLLRSLLHPYSLIACVFILVSLLFYQSTAMVYWVVIAIPLLFAKKDDELRLHQVAALYCIAFVAMGIYFVLGRMMMAGQDKSTSFYVFGLTMEPLEKIRWFVSGPLSDALAPLSVFPSRPSVYLSTAILVAGTCAAVAAAIRQKGVERFREGIPGMSLRGILALSMIPLSLLPNIVSSGMFSPYRTMVALVPVVVLLLYWALRNISEILPKRFGHPCLILVLAAVALLGSYIASYNVRHYFVYPASREVSYVRNALLNADLKYYNEILFIYPKQSLVFKESRLDEFGALTSSSKAHRVPQMITIVQTVPENRRGGPLKLSFVSREEFRGGGERTLVIDLDSLQGMYE